MVILLVVMVPAAALGTSASQQTGNFMVSVAGTATGSIPHQIDLKVTQLPGGQLTEVSGFAVSPEDVVQVNQGENIVVSTSADLKTHKVKVKVTNTQGQLVDLLPLPSNTWSLQGLTPGVYKLNVIADMSSSGIMGAFEAVLVILGPGQQLLPPTQYITMIQTVSVRADIIFKEDSNECSNSPGSANMGFPYEDVSECEVKGAEDCRKNKIDSNYCEGLKERFRDDCEGFKSKEECDEYWNIPPICDENTPPGVTCRDEGDPDDCEPGFVDRGFGCEREECPEGQTGIPPNCQPINCDVEDPPPECGEQPVVCPDGSTVSSGNECPESPGLLPPENGEEESTPPPPDNGEDPPHGDEEDNSSEEDNGSSEEGNGSSEEEGVDGDE